MNIRSLNYTTYTNTLEVGSGLIKLSLWASYSCSKGLECYNYYDIVTIQPINGP